MQVCNSVCQQYLSVLKGHVASLQVSMCKDWEPLSLQTQSLCTGVYHMVAQHDICSLFLQSLNTMPTALYFQCSGVPVA